MTEPRPLFEALNDPSSAPNHFEIQELPVTRAHRERAACTLHEAGSAVEHWIETGEALEGLPFNNDLEDLARAFADFEHEILLCPTTTVHGMEESHDVCSLCGEEPEDFHTIKDCFAKYKRAQDDAARQVTAYLEEKNQALESELYKNRGALHEAWEDGYAHGYDDREKMDHDRADVIKTENPYPKLDP